MADGDGMLPLQYAIVNNLPELARVLLEAYPDDVKEKDKDGCLPLHYAKTADVARLLLEAYPEAAKEKGECFGAIPIRYAASRHPTVLPLTTILDAYPDGVKEVDNHAKTAETAPFFKRNPEAVKEDDDWRNLPLQYAIVNNLPPLARVPNAPKYSSLYSTLTERYQKW